MAASSLPITASAKPIPAAGSARAWLDHKAVSVRGWLLSSSLAGLATGLLIIVHAGLFADIIARVVVDGLEVRILAPRFLILAGIIVLRALMQWLQELTGLEAGLRIKQQVRAELLEHIGKLGPVRLHQYHSAELAGQLLEHTEALHGYFARFLPQLFLAVTVPLCILITVWQLDWLAALFLLAAAPLIPLFMSLIGMGAERLNRRQFETLSRLSGSFLDRVRGLATLQLFGHAERSIGEVATAADDYRIRSMRTLRLAFLSSAVLEFFATIAIALVAIYIGFALLGFIQFGPAPHITLFSGLFILLLAPEFFQPLRNLSQHYHDRATALAAADILLGLLKLPVTHHVVNVPADDTNAPVVVEIDNACVEYTDRGRVLGPLSVHIKPGDFTAIRGESGAGKSTLLHIIAGFITPDSGHVRINGRYPRGQDDFAWLDQRPFLLQGSVAENLRLAAPAATDETLLNALRQVGLDDWLQRSANGLDSYISERGAGLSGGQAQRLALARIFLSPAKLVLLDEPTAHLDSHSETIVVHSLKQLSRQGRTLIVATHHPAVYALADQILHLSNGHLKDPANDDA